MLPVWECTYVCTCVPVLISIPVQFHDFGNEISLSHADNNFSRIFKKKITKRNTFFMVL